MIWKLVPNSHLGIFLGYSRSLEILHYYDTKSALVKTASQGPFDEVMNDLAATPPPNMQILWQLNNKGSLAPDEINMLPLDLSVSDDPFDCLDELSPAVICDHHCTLSKSPSTTFESEHTSPELYRTTHLRAALKTSAVNSTLGLSLFPSMTIQFSLQISAIAAALSTVAESDATSFKIVFTPD